MNNVNYNSGNSGKREAVEFEGAKYFSLNKKAQMHMALNEGSTTKSQKTTTSSVHKKNKEQQKLKFKKKFNFEGSNLQEVPEFNNDKNTRQRKSMGLGKI